MNDQNEDLEARLGRLGRATNALGPTVGFADRVMAALPTNGSVPLLSTIARRGRVAIGVSALAATLSLLISQWSQSSMDETVASSYGVEEVDW